MRGPPDVSDAAIRTWLSAHHRREATRIARLPPGADADAAAWRIATADGDFFLKLTGRRGEAARARRSPLPG